MLKRVSIQNFKSLKDVTLDLQKVNLLIGPNNSGKTNFLKALEMFDWLVVKTALPGSVERLAFRGNIEKDLKIQIHIVNDLDKGPQIYDDKSHLAIEITQDKSTAHTWSNNSDEYFPTRNTSKLTTDILSETVGYIKIYKPDPNKLIQPGPVGTGEETVKADASNLVGFLDLMLGKYRKAVFNRTENDLRKCVPEFDEINLDDSPATESLVKQYGDKSFKRLGLTNSKQGITYWADELSEGTLYFLALLCIINQPNPPKLLLLEEPEKGIHPRRIREVMNFIRRLVAEKDIQVIMTTHSPLLLDEFAESPEGVFVFDKEDDGATTIRNLLHDVIKPANQENERLGIPSVPYTEALGEYWTIGFLGGVPHETA